MSATLDPDPVARFLGGCPVIDVPGTLHPLTIEYAPGETVATALAEVLPRTRGQRAVFPAWRARDRGDDRAMPGASPPGTMLELIALHGSMDAAGAGRRSLSRLRSVAIIVSTNIAETSLTVNGVSAVIDTGLQKVARYDDERGVDSLTTERITTDSADQRAGRAAQARARHRATIVGCARSTAAASRSGDSRVDLSAPLLSILAWGASPESFEWFDKPSDDRIASAMSLLLRLGAIEGDSVTALGTPTPAPAAASASRRACCLTRTAPSRAAPRVRGCRSRRAIERRVATSCDLMPILDRWNEMPPHLRQSARNLEQTARAILGNRYRPRIDEVGLRRALLAGYPDRVARRRTQKAQVAQSESKVTLATGHGAVIGRESGVHDADWIDRARRHFRPQAPPPPRPWSEWHRASNRNG